MAPTDKPLIQQDTDLFAYLPVDEMFVSGRQSLLRDELLLSQFSVCFRS